MTDVPVAAVAIPPAEMPAAAPPVDLDLRVGQFVKLRDKIAEIKKQHEEQLRPFNEAKGQLEAIFSEVLAKSNSLSMRTASGTITATERASATLEDPMAFRTFVQQMGEWDLADVRANAPAVKAYAEANKAWPPGVKYSAIYTISVRRASGT